MDLLIPLAVIIIVLLLVVALVSKPYHSSQRSKRHPIYKSRLRLFSAAERSFLGVLDRACAERYRVFGKVRVADIITSAKGLSNSDRQRALNRITAKHVDFVLCDPNTMEFKAVVELHDASHQQPRRAERDRFLREAFEEAGLPYVEIPAKRSYSLASIKEVVSNLESSPGIAATTGAQARAEPRVDT